MGRFESIDRIPIPHDHSRDRKEVPRTKRLCFIDRLVLEIVKPGAGR